MITPLHHDATPYMLPSDSNPNFPTLHHVNVRAPSNPMPGFVSTATHRRSVAPVRLLVQKLQVASYIYLKSFLLSLPLKLLNAHSLNLPRPVTFIPNIYTAAQHVRLANSPAQPPTSIIEHHPTPAPPRHLTPALLTHPRTIRFPLPRPSPAQTTIYLN